MKMNIMPTLKEEATYNHNSFLIKVKMGLIFNGIVLYSIINTYFSKIFYVFLAFISIIINITIAQ